MGSKAYNLKIDGFNEPLEPVLTKALVFMQQIWHFQATVVYLIDKHS